MYVRLVSWLFAPAALLLVSGAWGATAVTAPCTSVSAEQCASAVTGVVVDGTTYNVSFTLGSFTGLSAGGGFPFLGPAAQNETNALDARDQILAALDAAGATQVGSEGSIGDPYNTFWVPYGEIYNQGGIDNIFTKAAQYTGGTPTWFAFNGLAPVGDALAYATFSVVPVPAAAWLFGSALGLLVWVRRRVT